MQNSVGHVEDLQIAPLLLPSSTSVIPCYRLTGRFSALIALAFVDDDLYEQLVSFRWSLQGGYAVAFTHPGAGSLRMHRLVLGVEGGEAVHHINGRRLDNRRENLISMSPNEHSRLHGEISRRRASERRAAILRAAGEAIR